MTTTDYDAPRRSTIEDAETDSLAALKTARTEAQSPDVDLDETDSGERRRAARCGPVRGRTDHGRDPETGRRVHLHCTSCFLVQHRSRIASHPLPPGQSPVCIDCA